MLLKVEETAKGREGKAKQGKSGARKRSRVMNVEIDVGEGRGNSEGKRR